MITSFSRPRLLADIAGVNCQMLTVIVPRRNNEASLTVRQLQQRRLLQVEIDHGGGTDLVVAALDHGYIDTDQVKAMTSLAMVRRSPGGGRIETWSIDGAPVVWHGPPASG